MNTTKTKPTLKRLRLWKAPKPAPTPTEPEQKSTFRYSYKITQTASTGGQVTGKTEQEAKAQILDLIREDEGVLFDTRTIQIALVPICISCEKEHRLEQLQPYGLCDICFPPQLLVEGEEI